MKHVFEVEIHFCGGSTSVYYIIAENDLEAREKAIKIDIETWGKSPPDIDYCVINVEVLRIDG